MNTKLVFLLSLVLSFGFVFTACGDDDEEDNIAAEAAGTYTGTLVLNIPTMGVTDLEIPNKIIELVRKSDNVIKLTLKDFSYGEGAQTIPFGDIVVDDIVVSKDGETIKLGDKTAALNLNTGITANVGISSATIKNKTLNMNISVSNVKIGGVDLPDEMAIKYTGTK